MGKFKLYNVDLKNLAPGVHEFEYLLENKFFVDIDGDEVQKGKVKDAAIFYFAVSLGLNLSGEYHRQQLYYNESFHFSNIQ